MLNTNRLYKFCIVGLIFIIISAFKTQEELPKVLIIGDSISIAYTPFVKKTLEGKAKVVRPMRANGNPENCAGTTKGVLNIERWIDDIEWDVIHFNFGLHDLKHVDPDTKENSYKSSDPLQADTLQYEENLRTIISKLKSTNAKLIFATTTPYPPTANRPLRDPGMSEVYNKVALKVMAENKVSINDLYSFVLPRMAELQKPNNVHFTEFGSKALAEKVSESILTELVMK